LCLSPRPFTKEFTQKFLAAPATVVSDGLWCFEVVGESSIVHQRHVTGGGRATANHPSVHAVNTAPGNLKTSLSGA
jgi:hypothetical protein